MASAFEERPQVLVLADGSDEYVSLAIAFEGEETQVNASASDAQNNNSAGQSTTRMPLAPGSFSIGNSKGICATEDNHRKIKIVSAFTLLGGATSGDNCTVSEKLKVTVEQWSWFE